MVSKIKIAHIHVWDKKNKGDVGIVLAVQEQLKQRFKNCQIVNFPIEALKAGGEKYLDKINACDLVVFGGGGVLYRYFLPFDASIINSITKPMIIFGVGYIREVGSRKLSSEEVGSIIHLVKRADLVSVRDYYTKSFLIKNGFSAGKINLIGDPAVLLSEKCGSKCQLPGKIRIGLNLNYSGWLGFGKWEKDILQAYRDTAKYFQSNFGAKIYYAMHHPDEAKILKKLKISGIKTIDLNPNEQKCAYAQLDLMIGMMLHSCVMAFGAGTPEINVAYDIRNKNFAKFIHCPELVIPLDKLKTGILTKRAAKVFTDREIYQAKFQRRISSIRKKHDDYLNQIEKLISCRK